MIAGDIWYRYRSDNGDELESPFLPNPQPGRDRRPNVTGLCLHPTYTTTSTKLLEVEVEVEVEVGYLSSSCMGRPLGFLGRIQDPDRIRPVCVM